MPVLTITLIAAILLAVAVPVLVWGLVPAKAGVDARRFAQPVPARAPGASTTTEPDALPRSLRWVASDASRARLERNLALAGLTVQWPATRVLRIKLIATAVALAAALVFIAPAPSVFRLA